MRSEKNGAKMCVIWCGDKICVRRQQHTTEPCRDRPNRTQKRSHTHIFVLAPHRMQELPFPPSHNHSNDQILRKEHTFPPPVIRLSLVLSPSHSHTHPFSLLFSLSLSLFFSLSLALSIYLSLSHNLSLSQQTYFTF